MTRRQFHELRDLLRAATNAGSIRPGLGQTILQRLWDIRCEAPEAVEGCACAACRKIVAVEVNGELPSDAGARR